MEIIIKRLSAAAMSAMIAASSVLPLVPCAVTENNITGTSESHSRKQKIQPSFSYDVPDFVLKGDAEDTLYPVLECAPLRETVVLSDESGELPDSFDLRDIGRAGSVKDQGIWGTCWAHSSASSAESSIMDAVPDINLSEVHTAYMPYLGEDQIDSGETEIDDILDYGGSSYVVANLWSQWYGPVFDKRMPYVDFEILRDEEKVRYLQSQSDFHLENAYLFEYDDTRSNFDELNETLKQFIYNGNAVDVSFISDSAYYDSVHCSYYTDRKSRFADHAVTIVGWDDNFSARNFNLKAPGDGAWLVKNSWGSDYADAGYMWISYYNNSLCNFAVYELNDKTEHMYNLHHDTFVPSQGLSAYDVIDEIRPSYMANIFEVETDMQLEAVSMYVMNPDTEYEITVYSDLTDPSDPASGKASAVTKGKSSLTGYITVELDENVAVKKGSRVGISVKMYCEDTPFVIPVETCMTAVDETTSEIVDMSSFTTHERIEAQTSLMQSFYSRDGIEWTDITESDFVYNQATEDAVLKQITDQIYDDIRQYETELMQEADKLSAYYNDLFERSEIHVLMGNITLKAFGNPVNTVDFSHISGQVSADDAVELSVKDDKPIYVSINGAAYSEYTSPIAITEKMTISATVDYINVSERTYTPAMAQLNDLCYKSGGNYHSTAERISESEYVINIEQYLDDISLLPVTSADIMMNGQKIESGIYGEHFELPYGETVFTLSLSEEGKLDNEVKVRVIKSPVEFDLENELIYCRDGVVVKDVSGNIIEDGSSVGNYAGQTLTAEIDGETFEVKVPSRAVLPEFEIDYRFETLGFIRNDLAELLVYSTESEHDEDDYKSAEKRLIDGTWINSGMVMNKALCIIPGEEITLMLKAGNGFFASEPVKYTIPECAEPPRAISAYTIYKDNEHTFNNGRYSLEDYTMEFTAFSEMSDESYEELIDSYGYSAEDFTELMIRRFGTEDETAIRSGLGSEWNSGDEPMSGTVMIRYAATESSFASASRVIMFDGIADTDYNGKIEASDAAFVLEYYASIASGSGSEVSPEVLRCADMDFDGKITASDASKILELYAELASA